MRQEHVSPRGCFIPQTIALQSVGCKLNQCETESLTREFSSAGYRVVLPEEPADIYLLNTCTVTAIADSKCRKLLREARRRNPRALVAATGCYAELSRCEVERIEGVNLVAGNAEKSHLVEMIRSATGCQGRSSPESPATLRTRARVKIQEGCSRPCTFCVVPRARGRERSRPRDEIISEIRQRVSEGHAEVVLTGTRIGSYDGGCGLAGLTSDILAGTGIKRLRVSSLEPRDLTPDLLSLWKDKRLCRHLHIPLQSGSDSVLERMGRSYRAEEFSRAASVARNAIPGLALTTDVMVGFPGETEDEFNLTYRLCEEIGFARLHVFRFSPRPGTRAARMRGRVENAVKHERARMLSLLSQKNSHNFCDRFVGQRMDVLWESEDNGVWSGHTDNYVTVYARSGDRLRYSLTPTTLVGECGDGLMGRIDGKVAGKKPVVSKARVET